ncbi:MAG: hypothetical protein ACUVTL_07055 [Thermoproteota archaeon]
MKKLSLLALAILFLMPQVVVRSDPESFSRSGHIGHYLYFVISAPVETKVGEETRIEMKVWASYDIVLTYYKIRIYGAGVAHEERSDKNITLPQGAGIPSTITFRPSTEGMVYLEVKAEYDLSMGSEHQQGYGDITIPLAYARTQTFEELKTQNQELAQRYYNYTNLEERYLELRREFDDLQAKLEELRANYSKIESAYSQLQAENEAIRENYYYILAQVEAQRKMTATYEYVAIASVAATIIMLIAVIATRKKTIKSRESIVRR